MDNHQAELAVALEKEGHLTVSTVASVQRDHAVNEANDQTAI